MNSDRSPFIQIVLLLAAIIFLGQALHEPPNPRAISKSDIAGAEAIAGLSFTPAERDSMLDGLVDRRASFERLRKITVSNNIPPAILFNPVPVGAAFDHVRKPFEMSPPPTLAVPANLEDLAFASVGELASLIPPR